SVLIRCAWFAEFMGEASPRSSSFESPQAFLLDRIAFRLAPTRLFPDAVRKGGCIVQRKILGLLFAVLFLVMVGFSILFPVEPYYIQTFGATSATIDRKSTRLNSSHVKISYAVFC